MSTAIDDSVFASPEAKQAQAAAQLQEARDRDAWVWMMGSPHGRRITRALIASSGLMNGGRSTTPELAAYREGRRSIGAEVLAAVKAHAPLQYTTLFEDENDE